MKAATLLVHFKILRRSRVRTILIASSVYGRPMTGTDVPHDAFFQMTIPDAAENYLTIAKHTKMGNEIAEALLKGGLNGVAEDFAETLWSILSRDERFVSVNSEWGFRFGIRQQRKSANREIVIQSSGSTQRGKREQPTEMAKTEKRVPAESAP